MSHFLVMYLLPFIGLMSLIVAVHELGHYLGARLLGMRVTHFSVGMGPKLWGWRDRRGCEWRIAAIPMGGYVRLLGDADAASGTSADEVIERLSPEERAGCFRLRPPAHRMLVIAAGPFANFVLAFAMLFGVYFFNGSAHTPPVIQEVQAGMPAAAAGLAAGDRILAVNGSSVYSFDDVLRAVAAGGGAPVELRVERHGAALDFRGVVPVAATDGARPAHRLGIVSADRVFVQFSAEHATRESVKQMAFVFTVTARTLGELFTFQRPIEDVGGPVRIAQVGGDTLNDYGFVPFLVVVAFISMNVGLVNLLPFPVLDGGHLVLYAIEMVRGRPLNERATAVLFKGGALALIFFFAAVTGADIGVLAVRLLGT